MCKVDFLLCNSLTKTFKWIANTIIVPESSTQQLKYYELKKNQKTLVSLSFICLFKGKETLLEDSLNSIIEIAEESGIDYEIVIVNTTLIPINSVSTEGVRTEKPLKIADFGYFKSGEAKNEALKKTTGTHIVLFDPEKVYDINFSDVLFNFISQREKRMLFSEFVVIPKEILNEVNGWSNLSVSEDIELFSRISEQYNILFYITEGQRSLERFLTYKPMKLFNSKEFKWPARGRKNNMIADLFIGCRYGLMDVYLLTDKKEGKLKFRNKISLFASYLSIKFTKRKKYRKSNFTVLMEAMFESVILQEYEKIKIDRFPLNITLGETEIRYLMAKSDIFPKISKTLEKIMNKKY